MATQGGAKVAVRERVGARHGAVGDDPLSGLDVPEGVGIADQAIAGVQQADGKHDYGEQHGRGQAQSDDAVGGLAHGVGDSIAPL